MAGAAVRAVVSIGTNSTRLLVAEGDDEVVAESRGTRLGTGLQQTGRLDPAARARTLGAVDEYLEIVRERGARVACIATSAMRRASDGDAFARAVADLLGVAPRVLSGREEATFSFLGATRHAADGEPVAVVDVGGGSCECAIDVPARARERRAVDYAASFEIGAVRLAETHPASAGTAALAPAAAAALWDALLVDAARILAPLAAAPRPARAIVVGGTAFTAAAMIAAAPLRDGVRLDGAQRRRLAQQLLERSLDERKALPFIRPQRADILPAGIAVLDEACRRLDCDTATVSVDDLLAGFLWSPDYLAASIAPPSAKFVAGPG